MQGVEEAEEALVRVEKLLQDHMNDPAVRRLVGAFMGDESDVAMQKVKGEAISVNVDSILMDNSFGLEACQCEYLLSRHDLHT